ncbi:MAG: hypothetical protein ACYCTD_04730 [bacterium]
MKVLTETRLFSVFIFLSFIVIFSGKASAYVYVGIMPYKVISTSSERYSYLGRSIPLIISSDLASGDIRIVRNSDIVMYAKKNHINFSSKNLLNISNYFKADYLIFGRIVKIGSIFVIQSNIFNVAEHKVVYRNRIQAAGTKFIIGDIDKLSGILKKEIIRQQPAGVSSVKKKTVQAINAGPEIKSSIFIKRFTQSNSGLIKTASKKYVIQAISTGRFLPEGIQTAVATRHRVILYNLATNGKMAKLAQYKLSTRSNVIYIGFCKISDNYRALVLTKAKLGMIISYLLVYRNGSLIKLTKNYDLFLRVMRLPGTGNVIVGQKPVSVVPSGRYFGDYVIGQNSYPIGQFGGETYVYKFNNNADSLIRAKKLSFYNGITLYGTVYGNIKGKGKNYLAALSNSGNLMIINNNGKTIYTGSKTYGGSPLQVRVPSFSGARSSTYTGGLIYNVPAQVDEFYHNGKLEIIVLKNYKQAAFLHNLNYYTKSSVFSLVWNKIGFYPVWEVKPVVGYSAGFSIFTEGKNVYLADGVVENPGSSLTNPKSYIAIYKIAP